MAMVVLGAIGDFAAFGMAPQSLATPMGSFTLVANTLFAHYWLKEPMSKRDIIVRWHPRSLHWQRALCWLLWLRCVCCAHSRQLCRTVRDRRVARPRAPPRWLLAPCSPCHSATMRNPATRWINC